MKNTTLFKTGMIGTALIALCCFTPVLVILFGAIGLASWVGHLDAILLPSLGIFIALTVYVFWKKDKEDCCKTEQ